MSLLSRDHLDMCVCVPTADGLPTLSLNAVLSQVGAKNLPFERKTSSAAEVRRRTDVHVSRMIVAQWAHSPSVCKLHFYRKESRILTCVTLRLPKKMYPKKWFIWSVEFCGGPGCGSEMWVLVSSRWRSCRKGCCLPASRQMATWRFHTFSKQRAANLWTSLPKRR